MKHDEHQPMTERSADQKDSLVDAVASVIVITCLVAMAVFWVSSQ